MNFLRVIRSNIWTGQSYQTNTMKNKALFICKFPAAALLKLSVIAMFLGASLSQAQNFSQSRQWPNTDFDNSVIDLAEIMSGGVPKDGIPAIDSPQFVSIESAAKWLGPTEPVIALEVLGEARAYPLQVLIWHEIVNDVINGRYVAVTFCPLCNASIVFDRNVHGTVLDFGTTGNLRNSDLVMYDRQTESWWQQITGRGLVGQYAGALLSRLPAFIVSFEQFAVSYPESMVLSRETGFRRNYGSNPYRGYDDIDNIPFLLKDPVDPRLPAMERVVNVTVGNSHRLYPFSAFQTNPVINDTMQGIPLVVLSKPDAASPLDETSIANSKIIPSASAFRRQTKDRLLSFETHSERFFDLETGSEWNIFGEAIDGPLKGEQLDNIDSGIHFAFAWLVFHPESEIYSAN